MEAIMKFKRIVIRKGQKKREELVLNQKSKFLNKVKSEVIISIFKPTHLFLTLLGLFLVGGISFGYAQNQLVMPRIKGPVTLDGLSNEPAWEGIEPFPVVMFMPNFG